jgi:hypothetical protein
MAYWVSEAVRALRKAPLDCVKGLVSSGSRLRRLWKKTLEEEEERRKRKVGRMKGRKCTYKVPLPRRILQDKSRQRKMMRLDRPKERIPILRIMEQRLEVVDSHQDREPANYRFLFVSILSIHP